MDVSEATIQRQKLEIEIQRLVNEYEQDTKTRVTGIKVERRHFSPTANNIKVTAEV